MLLLLPPLRIIEHIVADPVLGPLLHFEHDPTAHGEFWGHSHMMAATLKAKHKAPGINKEY